jgi:hypothetical protein
MDHAQMEAEIRRLEREVSATVRERDEARGFANARRARLALLEKVAAAARNLVGNWDSPDCDCQDGGHICGWNRVVSLRAALNALKEGGWKE